MAGFSLAGPLLLRPGDADPSKRAKDNPPTGFRQTESAELALFHNSTAGSLSDLGRVDCSDGNEVHISAIFRCVGPLCRSKS